MRNHIRKIVPVLAALLLLAGTAVTVFASASAGAMAASPEMSQKSAPGSETDSLNSAQVASAVCAAAMMAAGAAAIRKSA